MEILMKKKIGLFWLKDDFRITKNLGLIQATKKHDQVVVFYLYKKKKFINQEAQKWWIGESLKEFRGKLANHNINLEIIETESYKSFFDKLFQKDNYSIYWNKSYEPDYLKFDDYLIKNLRSSNIKFEIFKGNILNEFDEVKKSDGSPFKVFTPFWKNAEKIFLEKIPSLEKKISKCKKKISFFKNTINENEIFPRKKWFKKFEKYWSPGENNAIKELRNFINKGIEDYSESRNFPSKIGRNAPIIKKKELKNF